MKEDKEFKVKHAETIYTAEDSDSEVLKECVNVWTLCCNMPLLVCPLQPPVLYHVVATLASCLASSVEV